ncbi:polysaccharide lyase family 8 super-sandwich domain-containing protein [Streptomyces hoynatensis]|uniref:Silent information regulator protein Sir2 n=1 Tax=Streptomyces hoynatensis TaxID=1141874 RepID=A0A3A9YSS2_9ACTN|nr:polysaccharide lyase family 8 super-sandwich domain-containing protein [Streptomyces hoynatensis]RKN39030.1 silent information regulator protein Sir2 [Streptomyces hoynatensis]
MRMSRRALLSALPAAWLPAVGPPHAAAAPRSAFAAPAGPEADRARLLANALAVLAGTPESNARPEVSDKLAAVDATARARLAALDRAGPGELFGGLPLGTSEANLATSFQYLYEIALATRLPGTSAGLAGDLAAQRRVLAGLRRLYEEYYGDQEAGYYGNWFTWEIGISTHVSRLLVLLGDLLAEEDGELPAALLAAMDGYLRNGRDGDVDLDSRFHTGANLADITTNRILQGAALGDEARIAKAVADQLTVFATVDPYRLNHGVTDGFYADGSFLQHASVAYTGSYGTGLLTRVVQTIRYLDGTAHARAELPATVHGWVLRGFAPLIFEGWMMDMVRGRSVARTSGGYAACAAVVEAVTDLTAYLGGEEAAALAGYLAFLRQTARTPPDPAAFASPVTVARYADLLADPDLKARDLNPAAQHAAFPAMDRTVHRRPGYAFALARNSSRISTYEYMSGENLRPWFQGEGAHQLYLSGQDQSRVFGVDYYTTVPPHRLAGVTAPAEERRSVPELYGTAWYDNPERGFTSSSESQNTYVYFPRGTQDWSGGAALGAFGAAGLVQSEDAAFAAKRQGLLPEDFVAYRNATATKSWFMLDEEIVVLAAGVGDGAGRAVTSTFDSRIAGPGDALTLTGRLRDGRAHTGPGAAPLAWLRYANATEGTAVGYVFLDGFAGRDPETADAEGTDAEGTDAEGADRGAAGAEGAGAARRAGLLPVASLGTVTASRRLVRSANPDTAVTKQVFTVGVEQPPGAPPAALAWALVPHATERRLAGYARGPLGVLANSVRCQAIRHAGLGLLACNAFTPGTHRAGPLTVAGPASVLCRERPDGTLELAACDPTTARDTVSVTVRGRRLRARAADEGVRVARVPGGTRVTFPTRHAYGRSLTARLG